MIIANYSLFIHSFVRLFCIEILVESHCQTQESSRSESSLSRNFLPFSVLGLCSVGESRTRRNFPRVTRAIKRAVQWRRFISFRGEMIFLPFMDSRRCFQFVRDWVGKGWVLIKFRESSDRYIGRLRAREKAEDDQQMQSIMDRETFRCAIETSFRVGENYSRAQSRLASAHNLLFM